MAKEVKKLYRSRKDRQLSGVCGGVAEFFEIDSTIVRVLWLVSTVLTGLFPGVITYVLMMVLIPEQPGKKA